MEELSRNKLQEYCMAIIYDYLTYIDMGEEIDAKKIMEDVLKLPYEEVDEYVKQVCLNSLIHYQEIVDNIEKTMKNWKFSRICRVAQSILILAYSSFVYVGNIDKKVIINVAIKLAKQFSDTDDYKYINAILDKIL